MSEMEHETETTSVLMVPAEAVRQLQLVTAFAADMIAAGLSDRSRAADAISHFAIRETAIGYGLAHSREATPEERGDLEGSVQMIAVTTEFQALARYLDTLVATLDAGDNENTSDADEAAA